MASARTDRTFRLDLATLVGLGLALLSLYAGLRDLSFVHLLLETPYVRGIDLVSSAPDVLTGLIVPAIGLVVLAVVLGYGTVFDRRSRSVAFVTVLIIGLLYWSADVAFTMLAVVLAGTFVVLDVVSARAPSRRD